MYFCENTPSPPVNCVLMPSSRAWLGDHRRLLVEARDKDQVGIAALHGGELRAEVVRVLAVVGRLALDRHAQLVRRFLKLSFRPVP